MLSKIAILAALYSLVAADVDASASAVESILQSLDSQVQSWNSAAGLQGALGIQGAIPSLTAAVAELSSALPDSVTNDEAKSLLLNLAPLGTSISSLLNDLASKANDFESVGASQIVKGDISQLAPPAAGVVSKAINGLPSDADSDVLASASSIVSVISAGFSTGAEAYGAPTVAWPVVNAGAAASGASESAAPSGAESSAASAAESGAESSAAESGAESSAASAAESGASSAAESGASSAAESGASSAAESGASSAAESALSSGAYSNSTETSSALSSGAVSSGAKSSGAKSSGAESSGAKSSAAHSSGSSNSTASKTSSSSKSSKSSSNAAVLTSCGVGAALAGVVAMLL